MPDVEELSAADRERIWRNPRERRRWAIQRLRDRWERRRQFEQEVAEAWKQQITEANVRQDLSALNASQLAQRLQGAPEDIQAYLLRQGKRNGLPPFKVSRDRHNPKVAEAIEDEKFLYQEQIRVFKRRYRKGEDSGERATVRAIVAEFHDLSVDELDTFDSNKNRKPRTRTSGKKTRKRLA
jgi:hypothetical protein